MARVEDRLGAIGYAVDVSPKREDYLSRYSHAVDELVEATLDPGRRPPSVDTSRRTRMGRSNEVEMRRDVAMPI
jgi:hypothetical protein